jgi:DNA ligase 1
VPSFHDFALVCQSLGQTSSRLQIAQLAGDFLVRLPVDEAEIAARFLVGHALPQGEEKRLQVSGRAIWRIASPAGANSEEHGEEVFAAATDFGEAIEILLRMREEEVAPTLTIREVQQCLEEIAGIEGRDSRRRKLELLRGLFQRAGALEGKYLTKILIREMRHGMNEGLMLEAIARMANRPVVDVRRAHMMEPDIGRLVRELHPLSQERSHRSEHRTQPGPDSSAVSTTSGHHGDQIEELSGLHESQTSAGAGTPVPTLSANRPKPLRPMLAAPAPSIAEGFRILDGHLALEHKLDGARVQIHCVAPRARIFSRRMNEISPSLPELIEKLAPLCERGAILDGEVIAVGARGEALAFQELMRRFGRVRGIERVRSEQAIRLFVFDLIGIDNSLLIDMPYRERYGQLIELAAQCGLELAQRIIPGSESEGQHFYNEAVAAGYEGVMAKGLSSLYTPGARGRGWLKIKAVRTLDLVIVAADWGYGRRHGWLSNYHLAARDRDTGHFIEVGKTFKGLTDADFREMTQRLMGLKVAERGGTVFVRPETVVEVAYSDIQRSPRYSAGMALRFARILHIRADKSPDEADTTDTLSAEFERQLVRPLNPEKQ